MIENYIEHNILKSLSTLQDKIAESETSIINVHKNANELSNSIKQELEKILEQNQKLSVQNEKLLEQNEKLRFSNMEYKKEMIDLHSKSLEHEESTNCILCCEHKRNVLFRPCNHLLICDNCSGKTNFTECIVCKLPITSYEYAYL